VNLICPTVQAAHVRHTGTTGNLRMMHIRKLPVVQFGMASIQHGESHLRLSSPGLPPLLKLRRAFELVAASKPWPRRDRAIQYAAAFRSTIIVGDD
jgi:hypothetical protein